MDSISEAINEGHLYKFFLKPWNDQNLKLEIRQAMEQYDLIQDNKRLHDLLVQQNDELKQINENLEERIRERTRSLEFQNKALQISHAILDDLPTPIIGVSSEMMVVMANKATQTQWGAAHPIVLGGNVNEFFESGLEDQLIGCLSSDAHRTTVATGLNGRTFDMELIPLTGIYQGQGIIMTLSDPHPATDEESR